MACSPCDCVNPCTRGYAVGKPNAVTAAIVNRSETAYDCKIASVPASIAEGRHAISATVAARHDPSTTVWGVYTYDLSIVELGDEGDAERICSGIGPRFASVDELGATSVDVGTSLCIVDEVHASVLCTQLGCA